MGTEDVLLTQLWAKALAWRDSRAPDGPKPVPSDWLGRWAGWRLCPGPRHGEPGPQHGVACSDPDGPSSTWGHTRAALSRAGASARPRSSVLGTAGWPPRPCGEGHFGRGGVPHTGGEERRKPVAGPQGFRGTRGPTGTPTPPLVLTAFPPACGLSACERGCLGLQAHLTLGICLELVFYPNSRSLFPGQPLSPPPRKCRSTCVSHTNGQVSPPPCDADAPQAVPERPAALSPTILSDYSFAYIREAYFSRRDSERVPSFNALRLLAPGPSW